MSAFKGATATTALINPASGGQLILKFRSWIDKNNNGVIDQAELASDWIVYTIKCTASTSTAVIPRLTTSINGVVVKSNNDGSDDHGSFAVNNKTNNIVCNSFTDQNGITDPLLKVYQTYTADNVSVPYCNNCAASMPAFTGAVATAALINPAAGGQLILRFRSWIDKNNNGVIDQPEPASDWIVYTIML
jgi:hypothetical protein